jgi:pimeloyl-ACP methyl ester carboxylesterase
MTQLVRKTEDEAGALVRLGFEEVRGFTESIGTMERDIAARVFGYVPLGTPIKLVHDTVAKGVVGAFGGVASAAGRGAQTLVERRPRPERPLSATLPGGMGLAFLNGLVGDRLEREDSPLQQPMAVRVGGLPVPPRRRALVEAFPQATPRLVVFVHGLMGEEHGWLLGRRQGREDYGSRLARDLGCTPVYIRYNTGRHISENGRSLADLLEALVDAWPVEVDEVALVGHSMGGLVSRSAAHFAKLDGQAWVEHVRKVISLGSPHMGAPLEQAVHYASYAFGKLPETRMMSTFLRRRSSGAAGIPRRCARPPARRCRCSRARRTASSPRR